MVPGKGVGRVLGPLWDGPLPSPTLTLEGPGIEGTSLIRGLSPLPSKFGGVSALKGPQVLIWKV